jgi:multisubunit Na+/H+ antiporter MnhF subunit
MKRELIARILIPLFLVFASGCARIVTKPASEVRLISADQLSACNLRGLTLTDKSPIVFGTSDPSPVMGGRIDRQVPIKQDQLFIRPGHFGKSFAWNGVLTHQTVKQNAGITFAVAAIGMTAAFFLLALRIAQGPIDFKK